MAATYEPIATTTLTVSAAGSINFSSIPNTYTDLKLVIAGSLRDYADNILMTFNGNNSSLYSQLYLEGSGSSAYAGRTTGVRTYIPGNSAFYTTPFLATVEFFNYTGATNKAFLINTSADRNGAGTISREAGLFRSTSTISSISLSCGGIFAIGTQATLYGIKAA